MANQTIPITLNAGPVPPGFEAADINQLMQAVATYVSGTIRADVSFFLPVLFDPTTFVTQLIFNSQQNIFKSWSTASGSYVALSSFQIGDVKNTFVSADQVAVGWVVLNGRAISDVPGLTLTQQTVLETLFGIDGDLPTVVPTNTQNLPAETTFSGITKPTVLPANGVIGALPIANPPTEAEVEALRDNTEILRDSTASVETQVSSIQDKCDELLTALRVSTTPVLYVSVFCGYP